jgi:heme-degrading monooxygenase HmoA
MATIITRMWHGKTKIQYADEYLEFLETKGIMDYKKTPGNLSIEVWRRIEGEVCHFWTVTKWNSIESIKQFAGNEYEKARYYPEDKKYLLEFEENVTHFETFLFKD